MPIGIPSEAADLIRKALQIDPSKRISASDFIQHEWFVKHGLVKPKKIENFQAVIQNNFSYEVVDELRLEK